MKIHISQTTRRYLKRLPFTIVSRGTIVVKVNLQIVASHLINKSSCGRADTGAVRTFSLSAPIFHCSLTFQCRTAARNDRCANVVMYGTGIGAVDTRYGGYQSMTIAGYQRII